MRLRRVLITGLLVFSLTLGTTIGWLQYDASIGGKRTTQSIEKLIAWKWSEYKPSLAQAMIGYDWKKMRLTIALEGLSMTATSVPITAEFPATQLEFSLPKLLLLEWLPRKIALTQPHLTLASTAEVENAPSRASQTKTLQKIQHWLAHPPTEIRIQDGLLTVQNEASMREIVLTQLTVSPYTEDVTFLNAQGSTRFEEGTHAFTLIGTHEADDAVLAFEQFPAEIFGMAALFSTPSLPLFHSVQHTHLPLSGTVRLKHHGLASLQIDLVSEQGNIHLMNILERPLSFTQLELRAHMMDQLQHMQLAHLRVHFNDGPTLAVQGDITLAGKKDDTIMLSAEINGMDFRLLPAYWPIPVGTEARAWVKQHMPSAEVTKAKGSLRVTRAMWEASNFTPESIDFNVILRNAVVDYLPGFPAVKTVAADAKFDGKAITIQGQGTVAGSQLEKTNIFIPYLRNPLNDIIITGKAQGKAADLLLFVPSDARNRLGITQDRIKRLEGEATTQLHLEIPLEDIEWYDVRYNIASHITKGRSLLLPEHHQPLEDIEGDATFDGKDVTFEGQGFLAAQEVSLHLTTDARSESLATNITCKTLLTPALLAALTDKDRIPFTLGGTAPTVLTITNQKDVHFSGKLDITGLSIEEKEWGFSKPKNESGTLEFSGKKTPSQWIIEKIALDSPSAHLSGSLTWNNEDKLIAAHLRDVTFRRNQLQLDYTWEKEKKTLQIAAKNLDLEAMDWKASQDKDTDLSFKVTAERAYFKNNAAFTQLALEGECMAAYCYSFSLNMHSDDNKTHHAALFSSNDSRIFTLHSDDMGYLSLGFGIYKNIRGGEIDIRAVAPKRQIPAHYTGTVKAGNFVVLESPFLAKFFMLTSVVGIGDLLHKGIPFTGIKGELSYTNRVLTLEDWRAFGASMGVDLNGTINFSKQNIQLRGTFVPFLLGINQTLAAIPLLGRMLSGNSMGIIGTNFNIDGNWRDPTMRVQPLSTLAPGFLRGLLGAL